eukprot:703101-Hanusia_phi.AAC.1
MSRQAAGFRAARSSSACPRRHLGALLLLQVSVLTSCTNDLLSPLGLKANFLAITPSGSSEAVQYASQILGRPNGLSTCSEGVRRGWREIRREEFTNGLHDVEADDVLFHSFPAVLIKR